MNPSKTDYRQILKYTSLFGGVQGLGILIAVVRNKLVAVILGPLGMGIISIYNATTKLVGDSTNMGVAMSGVKLISQSADAAAAVRLVRSWSVVVAIVGAVACLALSPVLSSWAFADFAHTADIALLAPVVALSAISGGELAVMKSMRQMGAMAKASIASMVGVLVTTIPIYYIYGVRGIVPSLLLAAALQCAITLFYSCSGRPYRVSLRPSALKTGLGMIRLGLAFVAAGVMGSGMEFVVRTFINNAGSLAVVGLYNAGYMMTMTYGGMVFAAMETDYFPRLSAIKACGAELNACVNRQIEVSLLIIAPLLAAFMLGLPVLLPLLYSGKFVPVTGMMRFAIIALLLRAVRLPISYIPLSRADSLSYLFMEGVYYVSAVAMMLLCFSWWGLTGTGVAFVACAVIEFGVLVAYTGLKYRFLLSQMSLKFCFMQLLLIVGMYFATSVDNQYVYWLSGLLIVMASSAYSYLMFRRGAAANGDGKGGTE